MGTYATTTSLDTLMLGTNFADTETASLAVKCITQAESEINKYLSRRYDLSSDYFQTTTSTPPIVTMWTENLSMGYMYRQLSRGGSDGRERGKELIADVLRNLQEVCDFKLHVTNSSGSRVPDDSTNSAFRVQCNSTNYSNTFNEDDALNWAIDADKLSDIKSGRS